MAGRLHFHVPVISRSSGDGLTPLWKPSQPPKCLFLNPCLGHVGGTRRLCVVADQYRDVDGLAEVVLRADGGPELVGEEWPLVWWGQLVGRDR